MTLPLVEPSSPSLPDPSSYRKDVERALERFVQTDTFRLGSRMGRLRIHDSRASGLRTLRRDLYTSPEAPRVWGIGGDGESYQLRRVAPLYLVSQVVTPKASRRHGNGTAPTDQPPQLWRSTIAAKLGRIRRSCVFCTAKRLICTHVTDLTDAARLNVQLHEIRQIAQVRENWLDSQRWRNRKSPVEISEAERERAHARNLAKDFSARRKSIVRSDRYGEAIELFVYACGDSLAYCLGESED